MTWYFIVAVPVGVSGVAGTPYGVQPAEVRVITVLVTLATVPLQAKIVLPGSGLVSMTSTV
jgi:hypothetical protein